jgi:hypothetical protein
LLIFIDWYSFLGNILPILDANLASGKKSVKMLLLKTFLLFLEKESVKASLFTKKTQL